MYQMRRIQRRLSLFTSIRSEIRRKRFWTRGACVCRPIGIYIYDVYARIFLKSICTTTGRTGASWLVSCSRIIGY